ncbi:MAG: acetyl-CoA carboxylase biotin carboxyl carrier protein subunit [Parvibaculum sp.]|nr:acetyl-CoA carboxylase biotin carboxyl carrier protein subunit [Parvibaculum sp.]
MARIEVKSEIAGKVWKVEAQVGNQVDEDDAIIILESMKMEIPVAAPSRCRVVELRVAEEDAVAEDQIIAIVETL